MNLPEELQEAIEKELTSHQRSTLKDSSQKLSERYLKHGQERTSYMRNTNDRLAYIAARMPATFAACSAVFTEVASRLHTPCQTLLDLGSGPGTALWAASGAFPLLQKMTAIEQDDELAALGKRLTLASPLQTLRTVQWQSGNLQKSESFIPHDLVVMSYVLGELDPQTIPSLIERAFTAAGQALIIIEPGTPAGFERIRLVREQLIALQGHMVAPCPHQNACPMSGNDWCHFAARLSRSQAHRTIKEGTLNYEDEKYSYVACAKSPVTSTTARILRHPLKRSGHIQFTLCTPDGLKQETISRKSGDRFKEAKDLNWGDSLTLK
jgi:ribosomal protein RSM22 (predicted rRNA methylase)